MCDRAFYIATTLKQIIEQLPASEESYPLQRLYRKTGYTAPEACDNLWMNVFENVKNYNDENIDWHMNIFNIYHNRFTEYKELYVPDKN